MTSAPRRAGFTLVEIMVTLIIVALFSSAVYSVFLSAVIDTRWVQETTAAARAGQSILRLLEKDLAACVAAAEENPHFVGTVDLSSSSALTFITATDSRSAPEGRGENAPPADLTTVTYRTADNDSGDEGAELLRLYREENPRAGRTLDETGESVLLDNRVQSFELEYYDGAGWVEAWNAAAVPLAVRIRLVLQRRIQESVRGTAEEREFEFQTVVAIPVAG